MSRAARTLGALAAAVSLACGGCARSTEPGSRAGPRPTEGFPVTMTDDEEVRVTVREEPRRIVTFAPSHTEILFALGLGERVVGVSGPFDDYPPQTTGIEEVAGSDGVEPNVEKVVSLEPDIVLTAFVGGTWKDRLRDLGVPVFTTLAASLEDTLEDIEAVGRLTGAAGEAEALTDDLSKRARQVESEAGDPVTCFLDLGDLFTVGPGSLEFDLLERAGCDPITEEAGEPYPQWSAEQLVQDDPGVYLVGEGVSARAATSGPGVRELTAVRQGRVHEVDSDLISRPGPRVVEGLEHLAALLDRA
jgi:iron complex transport system substrate-binding protein